MALPKFITFTGADEHTDIDRMIELSCRYPIEWGILFSPKRQGEGRYPPMEFVRRLIRIAGDLQLSAHLCGGHGDSAVDRRVTELDPLIHEFFDRAQVNMHHPEYEIRALYEWAGPLNVTLVLQTRADEFPDLRQAAWLFDASGGRGVEPKAWPVPKPYQIQHRTFGYAGGLGPDNVAAHVATIGAVDHDYWIDMESNVRTDDRFDLDKCEAVCRAVFGVTA